MSLWVDKYRPTDSHKLDYHKADAERLRNLAQTEDFPHLLVFGPSGAGKQTRISCLLADMYGTGVHRMRIHYIPFTTPSNKKMEITTVSSAYHIEVNPSDSGIYDRLVIMESIKAIASVRSADETAKKSFKVVVLTEVDRLTKDAQQALRRTMEKHSAVCRLILCCNSASKVIPAIRSRCLNIRVPAPTEEEIIKVLNHVCHAEKVHMPSDLAMKIAKASGRNLRRALLMAEATKVKQYPFPLNAEPVIADWEIFLAKTATMIAEKQDAQNLLAIRGRLYELLVHCIPAGLIMTGIVKELVKSCDDSMKAEIYKAASEYEHRMNLGNKSIYHLEAFVAKAMCAYQNFTNSMGDIDMSGDF